MFSSQFYSLCRDAVRPTLNQIQSRHKVQLGSDQKTVENIWLYGDIGNSSQTQGKLQRFFRYEESL